MTDRDQLEFAAKAAGMETRWGLGHLSERLFVSVPNPDGLVTGREWNPITDDGDALRLAVKLRLDVEWLDNDTVFVAYAQHVANNDPYAATRRAIVRAAAELGKAMP